MTTLRARYVFPVASEPVADGFVCLEGDQIVDCGVCRPSDAREARDLGNVAILPGLVNAHAHLDFGHLAAPLGHRGIPFVDWLHLVIACGRHPASLGIDESLRNGVTAVGSIAQPDEPLAASPVDVTALCELIAPTADRVAAALEAADTFLRTTCGANIHPGLSPHAPYSVHPDLLAAVVAISQSRRIPVAMHLAESPEEMELLRSGDGPLRELLADLGVWDAAIVPGTHGSRPLDYLRLLASAHRALIVHGNYLDDEEIEFLAAHADRMSAVYCPRSHDWFGHRPYPLAKMLAAGATVALGTDGRASSPDLSLLAEMRTVVARNPDVPLAAVLRMGTIDGARSLGRESELGSLHAGRRADLTIVALPDRAAADPHELVFDPASAVVACYSGGVEFVGTPLPGNTP